MVAVCVSSCEGGAPASGIGACGGAPPGGRNCAGCARMQQIPRESRKLPRQRIRIWWKGCS
jgi:hypothetical protein